MRIDYFIVKKWYDIHNINLLNRYPNGLHGAED